MHSRRVLPIGVLVVGLLMASCGGGSSSDGADKTPVTTKAPASTTTVAVDTAKWQAWGAANLDVMQSFTDFNPSSASFTVEACTFLVTQSDVALKRGAMPEAGFQSIWTAALEQVKSDAQYCVLSLTALGSGTTLPQDAPDYGPKLSTSLSVLTQVVAKVRGRIDPASATNTAGSTTTTQPATTVIKLFEEHGSGDKTTADFVTPAGWGLRYAFDCAPTGGPSAFNVSASTDGSVIQLVEATGLDGSDIVYAQESAGTTHLVISSKCNWTVLASQR